MKRIMTDKELKVLRNQITEILAKSVGWEYARIILEHGNAEDTGNSFIEGVVEDVLAASAWEEEGYYNDYDIRLAIGREFIAWLDIPY